MVACYKYDMYSFFDFFLFVIICFSHSRYLHCNRIDLLCIKWKEIAIG